MKPGIVALIVLGLAVSGCSGRKPEVHDARVARADYALSFLATGLEVLGDDVLADLYVDKDAECRELPTEGEYDGCIAKWDHAIDVLTATYFSVQIARNGLAAGEGAEILPCVAEMVGSVVAALEAIDVGIPETAMRYLTMGASLAEVVQGDGACVVPEAG